MKPATAIKGFCLIFLMGFIEPVASQQNLFNVPSSDITIKGKPFFQQQINFSQGLALLNTSFCWGLGSEAEIGFNVLALNVSSGGNFLRTNSNAANLPVYPFYTINFQKAFTLDKTFKLAFGTQTGYAVGLTFGSYTYSNLVTVIPQFRLKIISGLYYGSDSFLGPGDRNALFPSENDQIGFQFGIEQEMVKEKLVLLLEGISGKHTMGMMAGGVAYHLTHHWVISSGYQISNAGNATSNSLVMEFTYIPSAGVTKHIFRKGHHEAKQ